MPWGEVGKTGKEESWEEHESGGRCWPPGDLRGGLGRVTQLDGTSGETCMGLRTASFGWRCVCGMISRCARMGTGAVGPGMDRVGRRLEEVCRGHRRERQVLPGCTPFFSPP